MAEFDFDKKVARVVLRQQLGTSGGLFTNVFYAKRDDDAAMAQADADAIDGIVAAWWAADWDSNVVDDCSLIGVTVKLLDGADSTQYEYSHALAGAIVGNSTPPQVAFSVKKLTGVVGRRHRGRWFVAGLDETEVTANGTLTQARADAIVTALDELIDDLDDHANVYRYGFVSRVPSNTFRRVLNHAYADLRTDTQRRRLD